MPCRPLARILVSSPLNMRSLIPPFASTSLIAWGYDTLSWADCLYTFTTLMLLLHVSLTAELRDGV